ncbi:hypothetical protein FH972_025726 [Carpinus fangiana]|uniref:phosphoribosylamine--glycine ligase n=1 Tax=Carpinus fangiana TaxID=176857 RepID=A0A5N6L244_9ROSI|nr:hypothetical protein FH972_025726 [Carpinus fangiana]
MPEDLRVLLVGGGGREHALAWRLSLSPQVESIYVLPGNGGLALQKGKVQLISDVADRDYNAMVKRAKELGIGLVVAGVDVAVVDGIEDYFRGTGIPCFSPTKGAARIEGSKAYAKDFMQRNNIPTGEYRTFTNYEAACQYLHEVSHDVVIKASGLAAGKGVVLPKSKEEGFDALRDMLLNKTFGDSGSEVVIEEFLVGYEISILTFSDGTTFKSLPPAQDHKTVFDGDRGPNTGGMGCYSPVDMVSQELLQVIDCTILGPTFEAFRKEADPFVGCLFTGLMITETGPKVLEYNARFGDPETQALIPLLDDETDLAEVLLACTTGRLASTHVGVRFEYSACVVQASRGYPGDFPKGLPITGEYDRECTRLILVSRHRDTYEKHSSFTRRRDKHISCWHCTR